MNTANWIKTIICTLATAITICYGVPAGAEDADSKGTFGGKLNQSLNETEKKSHGIHVASWNYDFVGQPLLITLFIVAVCAIKILLRHARLLEKLIPESCLLIILGIVVGFLFLFEKAQEELRFLHFSQRSFFLFLLPPIILEAAYSLKDRAFVDHLGTIMLYAVVGTILNVLIVGPLLYGFYAAGFMGATLTVSFLECMIFSAIVAAVDPVAVLAIFEEIGVNKMLYFMVFGESLFNDAVTIVIYNMVLAFMQLDRIRIYHIAHGVAAFVCVSLGGMAIGFIYGFVTAFITKFTSKMRMLEPAVFYGVAYLSYISAELFHFSGIISIICCGLVQSYFAAENMSSKSYITVYHFSKVMSGIAESLIFIILGVMLVTEYKAWKDFNLGFSFTALILCIISRFVVVFFLAYLVNKVVVTVRKIRKQEQFVMAYGGLRGAVTFSLVFMLDAKILQQENATKNVLLTSAYLIIFFTTFLQGISIKPLVKAMRIRLETNETSCLNEINIAVMDSTMAGVEEIVGHHGSYYWAAMTQYLSDRFIRPAVQKFPNKNRSYSSFLAAYQEAHIKEKFASPCTSSAMLFVPTQASLWTELDTNDKGHIPHRVTDLELERNDQYGRSVNKEHELIARQRNKMKPKLSPLKLDSPRDMLALRDLLHTPPHKTVHYLFDKSGDNEDRHRSILNQVRHVGNIRRRHHGRKKSSTRGSFRVQNVMLETALVPLGVTLLKKKSAGSLRHLVVDGARRDSSMRRSATAEGLARLDSATDSGATRIKFVLGDKGPDRDAGETDNLLKNQNADEC